jgi:hypothetical protein
MSNFKKLVNARMAKTGENWQTAQRAVRAQVVSPVTVSVEPAVAKAANATPISTDPIDAFIASLRSVHIGSILVGRVAAVGTSATASVAAEHARDLAEHPKYFAQSASVQMTISLAQMHTLIRRGATEQYGVQRISVFRHEHSQTTSSVPCANCERWIWCGQDEHAGACECGQKYEITLDGPVDWSLPQGSLCMNCGEPFKMTEVRESRSPWHAMNERQQACDICFHMQHVGAWWVRKRAGETAAKVDLDARHSAVRDAVTKRGEASSRVVTTQPIADDATPTDPHELAALADAEQQLHNAVEAERDALRAAHGLPPTEGLEVQGLVRAFGGVPDAYLLTVKFNPAKGRTIDDALDEIRRVLRMRFDVLTVTVRRMDLAGHPTVCEWVRRKSSDQWTFNWHHAASDREAPALMLD